MDHLKILEELSEQRLLKDLSILSAQRDVLAKLNQKAQALHAGLLQERRFGATGAQENIALAQSLGTYERASRVAARQLTERRKDAQKAEADAHAAATRAFGRKNAVLVLQKRAAAARAERLQKKEDLTLMTCAAQKAPSSWPEGTP